MCAMPQWSRMISAGAPSPGTSWLLRRTAEDMSAPAGLASPMPKRPRQMTVATPMFLPSAEDLLIAFLPGLLCIWYDHHGPGTSPLATIYLACLSCRSEDAAPSCRAGIHEPPRPPRSLTP